jgi:predicted dehydrogenase
MTNSSLPNRRTFLKTSAGGAAALAGLNIARSAHAAGKQEIKIGMIGCGGRCSGAAQQSLRAGPDVKLAAMCDIFPDRLQFKYNWFKKNMPEQVIADQDHLFCGFDGYQKVIDSVDVVLIACASKFHPMYAEAGIRAGKHVFVEKPHGIDPVGVRRMQAVADLAKQKNLSLLSGLQSRFHNAYREAVQRIHDGAIGKVVAMQVMFLRGPYEIVKRHPAYTETQYQFSNWYHFSWLSGDDVTQSLVHNMDRAAWILHEEMPSWCFGLGGRSASFGEVYGDMFDHHTVIYEYAGGTRVYALCRTQNSCYGNSGDIIMGTKGQCDLGACRISGETNWRFKSPHNDPYLDEQAALIESVRNGKPINSGHYMAGSTMSTVFGQLACYTGRPLKWDEVANSEFQFGPAPEVATFDTPPPSTMDASGNYPLPKPGFYEDPLKAPQVPAEKSYRRWQDQKNEKEAGK